MDMLGGMVGLGEGANKAHGLDEVDGSRQQQSLLSGLMGQGDQGKLQLGSPPLGNSGSHTNTLDLYKLLNG